MKGQPFDHVSLHWEGQRKHRRKVIEEKRGWESREAADQALTRYFAAFPHYYLQNHMTIYRCSECGSWHLGRTPKDLVPKAMLTTGGGM